MEYTAEQWDQIQNHLSEYDFPTIDKDHRNVINRICDKIDDELGKLTLHEFNNNAFVKIEMLADEETLVLDTIQSIMEEKQEKLWNT